MPPSVHSGSFSTEAGHDQAVFSIRDVDPRIHLLQSSIAPITTMLMNMKGRGVLGKAKNAKVEWNERQTLPHTTTIGAGGATNVQTASIPVADDYISVGDYLLVRSANGDEWIGPVSATATGEFSVAAASARGALGTTGVALTQGEQVIIFRGNIWEGGDPAEKIITLPDNKYNYVKPYSTPFSNSDFLEVEATYGGVHSLADLEGLKMIDHMEEVEKAVLYSTRFRETSGTQVKYHMGGLFYYITSNVHTVVNNPESFDEADWTAFLRKAFKYDKKTGRRVVFCSGEVIETIDGFKLTPLQLRNDDLMKNIAIYSYRSSFGTVDLVHHRMLDDLYGTAWKAISLDLAKLEWLTFIPQQIRRNLPTRGHSTEHEIYQVNTMRVFNEETHSVFQVSLT